MTEAVFNTPAGSRLMSGLRLCLAAVAAQMRQAAQNAIIAYRTRRELHGLPDEILRDIGLTRGDIPYVALNPGRPHVACMNCRQAGCDSQELCGFHRDNARPLP